MTNIVGYDPEFSLWDYFQRTLKRQPDSRFLGVKTKGKDGLPTSSYEWMTYRQGSEIVD